MRQMRNLKYLLLLLLLPGLAACTKQRRHFDKIEVVETNTTSRLNKIKFVNDTLCLVAGGERFLKAEMLASTDGGRTWSARAYDEVQKGLYELEVSPTGAIYAAAFDGKMLFSRDVAQSWTYREIGNWEFHVGMAFAGDDRLVMVSRDGQRTGKIVIVDSQLNVLKTHAFDFGLNDVAMITPQVGYACGYGVVLKTYDAGDTWEYLDIKNDNFLAMTCVGTSDVWVCGYAGSVFHSSDAGTSWQRLRNGNSITIPKYHLQDILFTDLNNGWAVGEKGLIIRTTDGGQNWTPYNKLTEVGLNSIARSPDGSLLVCGEAGKLFRISL
ncbi:MAG: hypothetical protein JNL72_01360 [Flavipsychrobacter sp.]|nr:hypothetical protein [Flavipsychrobacter sp.]